LPALGRQARRGRRRRRVILVQRRAQGVAQRRAIGLGREAVDRAVQQDDPGRSRAPASACSAGGRLDLVADQEAQHALEIVVAADADDVGDVPASAVRRRRPATGRPRS
jgi:hypothetical protein